MALSDLLRQYLPLEVSHLSASTTNSMGYRTKMLLFLCILSTHKVEGSLFSKSSTSTESTSNSSSQGTFKIPIGVLSTHGHNISETRSFSSTASNGSYSMIGTITTAPPVTSKTLDFAEQDGVCYLGNQDCTYTGMTTTVVGPQKPLHLSDECLLWNSSCTGNKTLALDEFFEGTQFWLLENLCFVQPNNTSLDCSKYVPQDVMSEFAVIKDWMRSP